MRAHQHAAIAAVLILAACGSGGGGGDGGPTNPPPQTGSIRGTVVDQTAAPVPGAGVSAAATGQTTRSATTGQDGVYSFSQVPTGTWTVSVTAPTGYTGTGTASVTVAGGQQANAAPITLTKSTGGGGNPAPATAAVSMNNINFIPQNVEVRVGGTVTWTNNDDVTHNATGTGFTTTGNMAPGASVSRTMNTAGTIQYSCTLHPGMNGTITVR